MLTSFVRTPYLDYKQAKKESIKSLYHINSLAKNKNGILYSPDAVTKPILLLTDKSIL